MSSAGSPRGDSGASVPVPVCPAGIGRAGYAMPPRWQGSLKTTFAPDPGDVQDVDRREDS